MGNYTQLAGSVDVQLTAPAIDYLVGNVVSFTGGQINVRLDSQYVPAPYDEFRLVNAAQLVMSNLQVSLPALPIGLSWLIDALATAGSVKIVPDAASTGLPGDFNLDFAVDQADLQEWRDRYGAPIASLAGGDFLAWQRNYGRTAAVPIQALVPEPAAAGLALAAVCGAVITLRKRRNG